MEPTSTETETPKETTGAVVGQHVFGSWYISVEPNCSRDGEARRECTHCNKVEVTTIAALEHTAVTLKGSEPTCSAPGMTDGSKCAECGVILKEQGIIPSLEHTYGTWSGYQKPESTAVYYIKRTCAVCNGEDVIEKSTKDVRFYNGHTYLLLDISTSWNEARKYCATLGGYLATVTSLEEQMVIERFEGFYWLGGTDKDAEGVWTWVTGENWNYEKWYAGEPNNVNDEDCLAIWYSDWMDLTNDSDEQSGFICEFDYLIIEDADDGDEGNNDNNDVPGYSGDTITYKGHTYKVFKSQMSWGDAKAYCESLGGHLATITSPSEQEALKYFSGNYWLGGTDQDAEGVWKWITGEKWQYSNWEAGEPNSMGDENYLSTWNNGGGWNDLCYDSYEQYGFICEWDHEVE